MVVKETKNFIIFGGNELKIYEEWDWDWEYYYGVDGSVRNIDESDVDPAQHSREIYVRVSANWWDWRRDRKIYQRKINKSTYKMSQVLKSVIEGVLNEEDVDRRVNFAFNTVYQELARKFFVIDKDYIKKRYEQDGAFLTGLSTSYSEGTNTKEVIFLKNSLREAEEVANARQSSYCRSTNNFNQPKNIEFKIGRFETRTIYNYVWCFLYPATPLEICGEQINSIAIGAAEISEFLKSTSDLATGNIISINGIDWSKNNFDYAARTGELVIGSDFNNVRIEPSSKNTSFNNNRNNNTNNNSSQRRTRFYEVQQINVELEREQEKLEILAVELSEIIEKNETMVKEGKNLGLELIPINRYIVIDFETTFFKKLDEYQDINSRCNRFRLADNEDSRKINKNIERGIRKIYQDNIKAFNDKKNEIANEQQSNEQSKSPLDKLNSFKKQTINELNRTLAKREILKNIDLATLENGKYQNWENDINGFQTKEQIINYMQAFVETLNKGAKVNETKNKNAKNIVETDNNNKIDTNEIISAPSLDIAKQIAKQQIKKLMLKYGKLLKDTKAIWGSKKTCWKYLEELKTKEEVSNFVQKIEREMNSTNQSQEKNDKFPIKAVGIGLFFLALIGVGVLVAKKQIKKRNH